MADGTYAIAYLHPGDVSTSFFKSCMAVWPYDATHHRRFRGWIEQQCGASRVIDGRNDAVRQFLATDIEWLAFVDSDMGFDPDMFDRLIDAADVDERPVVGALAFANKSGGEGPFNSHRFVQCPTIYRWVDGPDIQAGVAPMYDYPKDTLVECDATGGACFVVHRRVLEQIAGDFEFPREWFDDTIYKGQVFSEDITFFLRVKNAGFPVYVHTGVQTSHHKPTYLTEDSVGDLAAVPTYVVVPFKNRHDLTSRLVHDLQRQGGYRKIVLCDNGSNRTTKNWLSTLADPNVVVLDCDGWNIHQMWNAGIELGAAECRDRFNVAILNNDIEIGDGFLDGLGTALRADPTLAVVGPNYDGRGGTGIDYVQDICAGRYDGTGGLPGFAFMLRGEARYRFPEQLSWWYGDNDMVATVVSAGARVGIVKDVTVTHVDGGSQTGVWDDPEMKVLLDADREWFEAKWRPVLADTA